MRPILTPFLALYWTTALAVLALVAADGGDEGAMQVMRMIGLTAVHLPAGAFAAAGLAFGLALGAALFFWALVQGVLADRVDSDDSEAVLRLAFGCAIGMTCLLVAAGAFGGAEGGLMSPMVLLAALAASYLAIAAERWIGREISDAIEASADGGARTLAVDAARHAALARLSGRDPAKQWEGPQ
ncbi:MAG: hypothetical protein F9K19_01555 [Rhizobiaceae bacterium]|nr:MAG: hypothetical protein F9K19_01555 [Rhizobiaceae bacterium]CAG1011078.1 hypothetical protein RHIZO_03915 [Rhizobiaceae bacterium]